jgi:hypothetical protein
MLSTVDYWTAAAEEEIEAASNKMPHLTLQA